jgi:hypothetical protein
MKRKRVRACRANKFLLVPKPRLISPENFWGDEAPTPVEVVTLIMEKIAVHREEIADAQDMLKQIADQLPAVARLLPKQRPVLVR